MLNNLREDRSKRNNRTPSIGPSKENRPLGELVHRKWFGAIFYLFESESYVK